MDHPCPGLARRLVSGCTDVVVQAQRLERRPSQVSHHQRLASFASILDDRTLGQLGGSHLVGAAEETPALMDDALREGDLDAAGGLAGAERAGAYRVWIIKAVDTS